MAKINHFVGSLSDPDNFRPKLWVDEYDPLVFLVCPKCACSFLDKNEGGKISKLVSTNTEEPSLVDVRPRPDCSRVDHLPCSSPEHSNNVAPRKRIN